VRPGVNKRLAVDALFFIKEAGLLDHQMEMDSQELHTTNINPSYESSISHPMLEEWSNLDY
jgi:hypothetical protein